MQSTPATTCPASWLMSLNTQPLTPRQAFTEYRTRRDGGRCERKREQGRREAVSEEEQGRAEPSSGSPGRQAGTLRRALGNQALSQTRVCEPPCVPTCDQDAKQQAQRRRHSMQLCYGEQRQRLAAHRLCVDGMGRGRAAAERGGGAPEVRQLNAAPGGSRGLSTLHSQACKRQRGRARSERSCPAPRPQPSTWAAHSPIPSRSGLLCSCLAGRGAAGRLISLAPLCRDASGSRWKR